MEIPRSINLISQCGTAEFRTDWIRPSVNSLKPASVPGSPVLDYIYYLCLPSAKHELPPLRTSIGSNISSRSCLFLPKKNSTQKTQTNRTEHNKHEKRTLNTRTEGYLDRACLHLSGATVYEQTPQHFWTGPPNLL